ncbi:protein TolQ [bacterium]|nr:protein TolQ [bacterium]
MENMGIIEMLLETGPVVKVVLLMLIGSSVLSWTIIFAKWTAFRQASKQSTIFMELFWNGKSLDNIFSETRNLTASPVSNVFRSGYQEFQKLNSKGKDSPAQAAEIVSQGLENVQRTLRKTTSKELLRMESMLPQLATVASAAPFVGLFGTVWGIMNSFKALGAGGNAATLEVVAPGIADALVATAVGLAAAIPAVIAYNQYANRIRTFKSDLDGFSSDFTNILKRSYLG